ncbi:MULTISPECIES: DUF3992 domain-containing protein [Bacillus cereus group]|uniref:DUF3992 domain-containing protein n=1 Tax=Bacillus cereus group TaxID=86661 RepID=UPI000CD9BB95|nr:MULTISPECIES: S-Ena type endospore appendage [Bacillus cereus group]MBG9827618.1 hypothetical protein [Bacillus wiedmannii]MED3079289.1 DUF3992 domain-containing protein [Bacillus wiedmannii]UOB98464.1 hypothetical protein BTI679_58630 [Bacillus wiedmannii]
MPCECSSTTLSCCSDKQFVQDKVCSPWSGTVVAADINNVFYTNNINQNVIGTGFVKYDIGPGTVTIEVLDSGGATIDTQTLEPGTSLSFTYRRFDSIQVVLPGATAGPYQGEFCITTRYAVT